jgi:hypothetical protein
MNATIEAPTETKPDIAKLLDTYLDAQAAYVSAMTKWHAAEAKLEDAVKARLAASEDSMLHAVIWDDGRFLHHALVMNGSKVKIIPMESTEDG